MRYEREPGEDDGDETQAIDLAALAAAERDTADVAAAEHYLTARTAQREAQDEVPDPEDPGEPDYSEDLEPLANDTAPSRHASHALEAKPAANAAHASATTAPLAPWPTLHPDAYYGLLGQAAKMIEPLTEADPAAVLVQLIGAFGNAVGRGPRIVLGSVRQWANLFVVIVGKSSKARKGTSWENTRDVIGGADVEWAQERIKSGLSSGEGVIHAVRDPVMKREPMREKGRITGYQDVEDDVGVVDKRLLIVESELARVLKVAGRKDNVLSPVLRDAFDTGNLSVLTKQPYKATGAHISIAAHVTQDELLRELSACDSFNGFANRFLWVCARRSKELPFGEKRIGDAAAAVTERLASAVQMVRSHGDDYAVHMDDACRASWQAIYSFLSRDRPGLAGSVCNRAEAQVLRLCLVYALSDSVVTIGVRHLTAALAVWRYCEESARVIFGNAIGDRVADEILRVLREAPDGITRDELRDHFYRNVPSARLTQALTLLVRCRLAYSQPEPPRGGKGRHAERWFATAIPSAVDAEDAEKEQPGANNGVNRVNRVDAGDSDCTRAEVAL